MHILFLTPMSQELQPLLDAQVIDNSEPLPPDLTLYTGRLDAHDLSVGLLGIGKVNAAYATTCYLLKTQPDLVVLFGAGGGVHQHLAQGTLHAAAYTWTHDYGAHEPERFVRWEPGALPIGSVIAPTPQPVDSRIKSTIECAHPHVEWKTIASGDAFINNSELAQQLAQAGVDIVDMESSVVVDIASKFNCPTLVIRVVSDKADDNAHTDFTESLEDVCQRVTPDILAIMRTAIDALQD